MRILALAAALGLAWLPITAYSQATEFSGPQAGERLPPLKVRTVYGETAGQEVDLIERAGGNPALLVFVSGANRPAARLTRALLNYAEMRGDDDLFAALVWLDADRSGAEKYLHQAISWWGVGTPAGISLDGGEGPGSYGLNRNVNVTVLVAKEDRVIANHALIQPSEADTPRIIADVTRLIGGDVPTPAQVALLSVPTRKRDDAPWHTGPQDVRLRRLVYDVLGARDDDAASSAADVLDRYVAENPRRRGPLRQLANALTAQRTAIRSLPAARYIEGWKSLAQNDVSVAEAESSPPLPAGDWLEHGFTAAQRDQIRLAFRQGIEQKFIPGGSLLIIHKGEVVLREAFGQADLATGRPFDLDAPCRIASLTKPHTATVLAILADRGELSLDDPVDRHLPAFRGIKIRGKETARRAPTVAECLSHTAGFPGNDALKAGRFDIRLNGELADVVANLATKDLLAEPGTRYAYSRLGYMTAGRVAEVVTGKTFPDVMQDVLLKPIGATHTRFAAPGDRPKGMPVVYERTADGFRERQGEPLGTAINPGGSLVATLDDVGRLMLLHRNQGVVDGRRIVSAEALAAMYVPRSATPGAGYGLGFNIIAKRADGTARRIRHTGASGTFASLDFDDDLIVVILTQVPQTQTTRWRQRLLQSIQD